MQTRCGTARTIGLENSQITSVPPGFVTRRNSRSAASGVGDVAQAEGDDDAVDALVGQRQRHGVAGDLRARAGAAPSAQHPLR